MRAGRPIAPTDVSGSSPRWLGHGAGLTVALLAVAVAWMVAFSPTLSAPFIADDFELIQRTAQVREGTLPLSKYFSLNHNEHRIPVMRGVVLAGTALGNLDPRLFRAAIMAVHLGCAVLVVLMTRHALGLTYAAVAGALFVVSGSFSLMVVWAPTSAVFSLSLFFVLLARHALGEAARPRRGWASAALLGAMLSLNGSVVCVPSLIVGYWHRLGETPVRRGLMSAAWLIGAVAVFRWSSAAFVAPSEGLDGADAIAAARNASFLVLSAPVRWMVAWSDMPGGYVPGPMAMLIAGLVVGLLFVTTPPSLRRPVLVLMVSAVALSVAVAFGRRAEAMSTIYETDRYYYAFGAPFAVITAAGARCLSIRLFKRQPLRWVVLLILPLLTWITYREVHTVLKAPWIEAQAQGVVEARLLAGLLKREAARQPLAAPDGLVPLTGVPGDGLTLRAIVRGMYPGGLRGLTIVTADSDDDRVNAVLDEWSRQLGESVPPIVAENGRLRPTEVFGVDFSIGPFGDRVAEGFHGWASTMGARWLSRRGRVVVPYQGQRTLVVDLHLPSQLLTAAGLLGSKDALHVSVNGARIGSLALASGDHLRQAFALPSGLGPQLDVGLESTFVWRARQIYPENLDPRELSVSVRAILLSD